MKRRNWTRALSFLLVICLLLGMMPSAFAGSAAGQNVTFEEVLPDENTADLAMETGKPTQPSEEEPAEDEMVRVSIVLEKQATLEPPMGRPSPIGRRFWQSSKRLPHGLHKRRESSWTRCGI